MKVIQPNCRIQFTVEDIEFIFSILDPQNTQHDSLLKLLSDEDTRDLVLDNESLFDALIAGQNCLRVSTHFYFYVLVRRVFRETGIDDAAIADYVAEVLSEFSSARRVACKIHGQTHPLDYFFEMLSALQTADDRTGFEIRAHIGNQSLFMSGLFRERIQHRCEYKGAPSLSYYEQMGRSNFRVASDHRLAKKYEVSKIYSTLADRFTDTRLALNELTDRLLFLGNTDDAVDMLLN